MAKIFYIKEQNPDYNQIWIFNNEKKAVEKGMELVDGFEFGEWIEGDFESFYYSESVNIKDGICFYTMYDGEWDVADMTEKQARDLVTFNGGETAGVFFPARLKSGYGEAYLGRGMEHTNALFMFDGGSIQESNNFKYLPTFESFTGTVNEEYVELPGFDTFTEQLIDEFKEWYKATADNWEDFKDDMAEDSVDEAAKNAQMEILAYLSNEMNNVIKDRKFKVRADFR